MPRIPEEQIAKELHELNRTMKDMYKLLQRFLGVQYIQKKRIIGTYENDSREEQSL